jgi:hypothetical protein
MDSRVRCAQKAASKYVPMAARRPRGDYVINMLHIHEHSHNRDLEDMVGRNTVAAITNRADLSQLIAVLYQIRNNMFHGEKIPGDMSDDRIVRVARPVLEDVVKRAYETTAE